ncbi:MAG: 3-phosphoshikimate 1-carboxyvinyltransferase, partial [Bacteroidetes bacterium]|nr:3-phosphoshikimate 1-carboxyvinyltransferase [Bacteroidota bacterium]
MAITFFSEKIYGTLIAPPSKSAMQRAIVASLLSNGTSVIVNPSECDDSLAVTEMARVLGATVKKEESRLIVNGGLRPSARELNCGESGLALRMFSAVAAMWRETMTITGKGSLVSRPVDMIEKPLIELGATVETNRGRLPIRVRGPLRGGVAEVDGSVSSQFLTGLLFSLPLAENDSIIHLSNPTSKPYIDMTVDMLSRFGIEIENRDYSEFIIRGRQLYKPATVMIEGDWSGASFFLVMAAIGGEITIGNLITDSLQADRRVVDALRMAGLTVITGNDRVTVKSGDLKPFRFDITDCPDLAPPLAVLAAACKGKTVLSGTARLSAKESSRGENIRNNLEKLGSAVRLGSDTIEIEGSGALMHAMTSSFSDHRMAMAMAAASVLSTEGITLDNVECISKSYPGFIDDFVKSG